LNFSLDGDFSEKISDMNLNLTIADFDFLMDNIAYSSSSLIKQIARLGLELPVRDINILCVRIVSLVIIVLRY